MAKAYDKDFLVAVYMAKFLKMPNIAIDTLCKLEENASALYDRVGKTEFRTYASITAETIREYQND